MKVQEAAKQLKQIAASVEETGQVDTRSLARLISSLEGESARRTASRLDVAATLRQLAEGLGEEGERPSRHMLASALRRVLAETADVRTADVLEPEQDAQYNMSLGFGYIRDAARMAYLRGATGTQMRQAFDQLATIVSEIGLMCDSIGASDAAALAIRMSKAVRLARRFLKPDVLDSMVLASEEKESRFEEDKPADPTENMSEADAKEWKANTDKYEDKFKAASNLERRDMFGSDEKESRFEEGKPADPTENMSDGDAKEWKANTDKYEDKFKAAGVDPWKA